MVQCRYVHTLLCLTVYWPSAIRFGEADIRWPTLSTDTWQNLHLLLSQIPAMDLTPFVSKPWSCAPTIIFSPSKPNFPFFSQLRDLLLSMYGLSSSAITFPALLCSFHWCFLSFSTWTAWCFVVNLATSVDPPSRFCLKHPAHYLCCWQVYGLSSVWVGFHDVIVPVSSVGPECGVALSC